MKKIILAIVVIAILGFGYYTISPYWRNIKVDEASPLEQMGVNTPDETEPLEPSSRQGELATADFVAMAHEVEGQAKFIRVGDQETLRFEDFKTINGPDLRIYLSTDKTSTDFVDLGPIQATEGNVNYTLPADIDLEKYDTVLVWCRAFSVLFSYAELQMGE